MKSWVALCSIRCCTNRARAFGIIFKILLLNHRNWRCSKPSPRGQNLSLASSIHLKIVVRIVNRISFKKILLRYTFKLPNNHKRFWIKHFRNFLFIKTPFRLRAPHLQCKLDINPFVPRRSRFANQTLTYLHSLFCLLLNLHCRRQGRSDVSTDLISMTQPNAIILLCIACSWIADNFTGCFCRKIVSENCFLQIYRVYLFIYLFFGRTFPMKKDIAFDRMFLEQSRCQDTNKQASPRATFTCRWEFLFIALKNTRNGKSAGFHEENTGFFTTLSPGNYAKFAQACWVGCITECFFSYVRQGRV